MNVDEMPAGPEMDALIAERVMGCGWIEHVDPHYSRNMGAAWLVVETVRRQGWLVRVQEMPNEEPFIIGAGWRPEENLELHMRAMCQLYPAKRQREGRGVFRDIIAFADSTPLAICRAALKAQEAMKGSALAPSVASATQHSPDASEVGSGEAKRAPIKHVASPELFNDSKGY